MRARGLIARSIALGLAVLISPAASSFASAAIAGSNVHGAEADCVYKTVALGTSTGFKLRKIVVSPPTNLLGHTPNQAVGFRVVVQRSYPNNDGPTPIGERKSVFVSELQMSVASPDQAAVFSPVVAPIRFVSGADEYPNGHRSWFRTVIKVYRFNADGTVESHGRGLIWPFDLLRDGHYVTTQYGVCDGAWLDQPNSPPFPI